MLYGVETTGAMLSISVKRLRVSLAASAGIALHRTGDLFDARRRCYVEVPLGEIDEHSTDICGCGLPGAADMSFTDPTSQKRRPAGRLGGLMESDVALSQSREVEECL